MTKAKTPTAPCTRCGQLVTLPALTPADNPTHHLACGRSAASVAFIPGDYDTVFIPAAETGYFADVLDEAPVMRARRVAITERGATWDIAWPLMDTLRAIGERVSA